MKRGWILTAALSLAFVGVSALVWALLRPEPLPDTPVARPQQTQDSGRVMDLEHLTEADLRFLEEILDQGEADAQVSASRALVAAGDARGAPLLLARATPETEQDMLFCLAGMDILRMQRFETAARILVLSKQGSLSSGCVNEVDSRLGVLARDQGGVITLAQAPEAEVRRWAAYKLNLQLPPTHEAIGLLAMDPDADVRRAAWLAIDAHGMPLDGAELRSWADKEPDPQLQKLINEVVSAW